MLFYSLYSFFMRKPCLSCWCDARLPPIGYNFVMEVNQPAPNFTLNDLDGTSHTLADYRGGIVIINFWSAECPHAARVDLGLLPLLKDWGGKVHLLQIASNGNEPLEMLKQVAEERSVNPILQDADHKVADLYEATNTPHIYILDEDGLLQYHGAYDDVAFRQRVATRNYVRETVETLLNGGKPEVTSVPPFGCTIVRMD
ncbi:MAG: redoxin domain-containing protein [Anaerolineae bacterium]|nr:redoxin domain-containing protein [Anaerolineae bacterium]